MYRLSRVLWALAQISCFMILITWNPWKTAANKLRICNEFPIKRYYTHLLTFNLCNNNMLLTLFAGIEERSTQNSASESRLNWCRLSERYLVFFIMGPSFLEGGPVMYPSCPSFRLSRAYFFLRIVLGTWALTRTENEIPIVKILQGRPHSRRPLNDRTLLLVSCRPNFCFDLAFLTVLLYLCIIHSLLHTELSVCIFISFCVVCSCMSVRLRFLCL